MERVCTVCKEAKSIGAFYKGAARCKVCANLTRSSSKVIQQVHQTLRKFTSYRANVQWHMDNNNAEGNSKSICIQRINDYTEIINDLTAALYHDRKNQLIVKK